MSAKRYQKRYELLDFDQETRPGPSFSRTFFNGLHNLRHSLLRSTWQSNGSQDCYASYGYDKDIYRENPRTW